MISEGFDEGLCTEKKDVENKESVIERFLTFRQPDPLMKNNGNRRRK